MKKLPSNKKNEPRLVFLEYAYLDDDAVLCHTAAQYSH